ncbi:MAG: phosphoenolpyruvate synthase [Acidimicrobiia bacterium]
MSESLVVPLEKAGMGDVAVVGGKNASLGEMIQSLESEGVRVPGGFATTAAAYRDFVTTNGLDIIVKEQVEALGSGRSSLRDVGAALRSAFLAGDMSDALVDDVGSAYVDLADDDGAVAVRSSATAEDLPDASFAGQQETFLNVRGREALLDAVRRCFASLFTDRAIAYREEHGFDHGDVALSVGVQQMVRAGTGASGVMFTLDPETGFPGVVVIEGAWGLGENVVQGAVDPDAYWVFKAPLDDSSIVPIIDRRKGSKERRMVATVDGTANVPTSGEERARFVLDDHEVLQLARWAVAVERHYGRPMDLEWAKDGVSGELFILQARPETVESRRGNALEVSTLCEEGRVLLTGTAVGARIASGRARRIAGPDDFGRFEEGDVLVADMTDPDWVPLMRRAGAVVTDHGGRTCHAAIVCRELGVPAVVGTEHATAELTDGQDVTVSCAGGSTGQVYDGLLEFETEELDVGEMPETRTRIMLNIASPDAAFRWWRLPARGIGLARMEFVINDAIKIHPMALAHPDRVTDPSVRSEIAHLTRDYDDPAEYFVDRLASGLARLAVSRHPEPVIVRMSDFKTNEYADLIGGRDFEFAEDNPMIGFRGASRYYDDRYRDGFLLECRAIRRLREEIGLQNVLVMIPFCRTIEEADRVLEVMADAGLRRGENGLEVYVMCEIPSNVVLADQFAERFDGFSIGSNDLTQLTLGVDRDSEVLAHIFDERNEAVVRMIRQVITVAHEHDCKVGICGQAPSDHTDFAEMLVEEGIDSISLNPDSVLDVLGRVAALEATLEAGR